MRQGVLVMSYGTPERLEDVAAYYTHIRRGDPPPRGLLDELVARYRAVGGPTALNEITRRQAAGLERGLAERGTPVPVYAGFKHVAPFVGEVVQRMVADGVERIVGFVLAPHYSLRSIAEYEDYARRACPPGRALDVIPSWHDHAGFVAFLARRLGEAIARAGAGSRVLFTAHSVPERVLEAGDPYRAQLLETCGLVARRAGIERWEFAFQSAGRTSERWLGPDVLDVIPRIAAQGARGVVVQAVGFVADHLEILYDLDVEARAAAKAAGLAYGRAAMPNDDPAFLDVLAAIVHERLERDPDGCLTIAGGSSG